MAVRPEEIASIIREQIEGFETGAVAADTGTVVQAGDGIARIYGLAGALSGELLEFSRTDDAGQPIVGMALNLEEDIVGAVVLGDYRPIEEGDEVRSTTGAVVPLQRPRPTGVKGSSLLYNEFVVFDPAQVIIRYVAEVEFTFR